MTRSSEVSRAEPTSAMVIRSRAREGRGGNVVPEIEFRPETETRQEVHEPAEIQVSMSATRGGAFGPIRSSISDSASQYVTADRPESKTTAAFHTGPETNPSFSDNTQNHSSHTAIYWSKIAN